MRFNARSSPLKTPPFRKNAMRNTTTHTTRRLPSFSGKPALLALALLAGNAAVAQQTGWYAGATVGEGRARIDEEHIANSLLNGGLVLTGIQQEQRAGAYKVFGGYQVNRNLAVEGGYFDLGNFGFTSSTAPAGALRGNIRLQGLNLDLVGLLPITHRFSATARVGLNYTEAVGSFSGTGAVRVLNPNSSTRETNVKFGLGLHYALTDSWSVRTDLERYRINDAAGNHVDVDQLLIGLVYQFGVTHPDRLP
jgi:OOP family OmpA-OmpF porin